MQDLKLGKYQHFKGKICEVIDIARHGETLEEMVIYRELYDSAEFGKNPLWVRPKEKFCENILVDGKETQRFKFIE